MVFQQANIKTCKHKICIPLAQKFIGTLFHGCTSTMQYHIILYISYNIAFGPAEYRAVFSTTNVFFKLCLYVFKYAFRSSFGSSRSEVFFKMDVLRNFAKFTGKHLCRDSFLIKLQALGSDTSLFL